MYEVFEQQLQNNGLSARQVSLDTGIGTATPSEWKAGGLHPRNDKIKKLADYFGVAAEYIKKGIKKEPVNTDKLPDKVAQARICSFYVRDITSPKRACSLIIYYRI